MELLLRNGMVVLYDDVDRNLVDAFRWYAVRSKRTYYADAQVGTQDGKRVVRRMHRLIMLPPLGMQVDHINGNGLDNRRSNLRICTPNDNRRNTRSFTGSSRFKGVAFHKREGRWSASICSEGRDIWLGYYTDEEAAARAYNEAAPLYHGEFASLNILGGTDDRR